MRAPGIATWILIHIGIDLASSAKLVYHWAYTTKRRRIAISFQIPAFSAFQEPGQYASNLLAYAWTSGCKSPYSCAALPMNLQQSALNHALKFCHQSLNFSIWLVNYHARLVSYAHNRQKSAFIHHIRNFCEMISSKELFCKPSWLLLFSLAAALNQHTRPLRHSRTRNKNCSSNVHSICVQTSIDALRQKLSFFPTKRFCYASFKDIPAIIAAICLNWNLENKL